LYESERFLRVEDKILALFISSFAILASLTLTPPIDPNNTHLASYPKQLKFSPKCSPPNTGSSITSTPLFPVIAKTYSEKLGYFL
jgi:hypothetical protein